MNTEQYGDALDGALKEIARLHEENQHLQTLVSNGIEAIKSYERETHELKKVNQELLEALQAIVRSAELNQAAVNTFLLIDARSAIAKAGGSNAT